MTTNNIEFQDADVVFVADMFREDYAGGAELTTDALFTTSPVKAFKLRSSQVTQEAIGAGMQKTWVFFNFREMDHNLIPVIIQNLNYFVVEYDYKFCAYRSLDLHLRETGNPCNCHEEQIGKIISTFYVGAEKVFWMSHAQKAIYQERFPFLDDEKTTVLSSVFNVYDLEQMEKLHDSRKEKGDNGKYAVVDGRSWIKGLEETQAHLTENNIEFDVLSNLSYNDLLRKLSEYKGLAFMPLGGDTCPRLVIEAKLMGLELILNDNVQHKDEEWFVGDRDAVEMYLLSCHDRFWDTITEFIDRDITVSGYTQAYNVMESNYPWRESINSLLGFCDEVVVLDGGSNDGTYEELQKWAKEEDRLVVRQLKRDWDNPRFALYNGQQKAAARTLCTKEWCWQVDIDEVVHEEDYHKVKKLLRQIPKTVKMICLPVIEYWGGTEKVRVDVNPWKWRLSKNDPHITHDVNADHRRYDEEGNLYSAGSDGDDYVSTDSYQVIPSTNFYTPAVHEVRMNALKGDEKSLETYENFINAAVRELPGVHHYSWFDLKRKVYSYKNFWSKHWASLYNKVIDDVPENNMFFDKKWADVSDKEIDEISQRMKEEMGGWIFHERIDFSRPTPSMQIEKSHPGIMKEWLDKHSGEQL
tara:strand:+ start:2036 stop:3952 length:1917 start_codon:yes stop_codon:yes gene_type:complete